MPIYPGDKSSLYFPRPRLLSSPWPPWSPGVGRGLVTDSALSSAPITGYLQLSFLEQFLPRPRPPGSSKLLTVSSRLSQTIITINTEPSTSLAQPPLTRKQGQNNQTTIFIIPHRRVPALPHCWEIHYDAPGRVGQPIPSLECLTLSSVPRDSDGEGRGIV